MSNRIFDIFPFGITIVQNHIPAIGKQDSGLFIDDFRNHVCLFLGMTNPNVNLNDVDNVVIGLNIMPKNVTNIIKRNYIYQNYMYSLYYDEDYDLIIITIQGRP